MKKLWLSLTSETRAAFWGFLAGLGTFGLLWLVC